MNIKQTKKLIDEGYNNLYVLTNIGWKDYRDEMLTSERKAVKKWRDQTRNIWGIDRKYLLTITEEAKFFCVQHVIEAMLSTRTLRLKEALHVKSSYALAHALMDGYPEKIIEAFDGFDVDKFLELSHTEFSTEKEVA